MKNFSGFPLRMDFTPVPRIFINQIMPEIQDAIEIKVLLHIMNIMYTKKGNLRSVSFSEIENDPAVQSSLKHESGNPGEILERVIQDAVNNEILLALEVTANGKKDKLFFLNSPVEKKNIARICNGEITPEGITGIIQPVQSEAPTDIFSLYEDNIGQITPMIAEELKDALNTYPEDWIKDSIREAAISNKRNWRYISRILERWATEGKKNGTYKRDSEKTGPEKYFSGPYGHLIQH